MMPQWSSLVSWTWCALTLKYILRKPTRILLLAALRSQWHDLMYFCIGLQAYGAVLMARVLTTSGNAGNVAREAVANEAALSALLAMLASWEEPVRLAAVRAFAKITWLVSCLRGVPSQKDPASPALRQSDPGCGCLFEPRRSIAAAVL